MQSDTYSQIIQAHSSSMQHMQFFKQLYEKNNPTQIQPQSYPKIPKILHHIWLGSKLPDEFMQFYQSWIDVHPDWRFIFWTDDARNYDKGVVLNSFADLETELAKLDSQFFVIDVKNLAFDNRIFFDSAINYGEKSDILKWEVVYRFGGVYVDIDFECLKPLDVLNHIYDFYTGIQPLDTNIVQLGAALFAAIAYHPILAYCVKTIKDHQHIPHVVAKTGPIHFTRSFLHAADRAGCIDIALPASYFYPCSYEQRNQDTFVWYKQESFAIHHWAGSWLKPQAFVNNKG